MIKINLLPKTINEKAIIRRTAMLFAAIFVVIIASGIAFNMKLRGDVEKMEAAAAEAEAWEARVKGYQDQATNLRNSIKPIEDKLNFINAVLDYNQKYPELYEEVAKWTYERVSYTSMQSDGTQVVIGARAKTLDDVGRFLLNMYRATDLFTEVAISGVPGYPLGQSPGGPGGMPMFEGGDGGGGSSLAGMDAISIGVTRAPVQPGSPPAGIDFSVVCKLKTPIVQPAFAGAAPAGAPGAPGAPMPAPMPSMPSGPSPGMPGPQPSP